MWTPSADECLPDCGALDQPNTRHVTHTCQYPDGTPAPGECSENAPNDFEEQCAVEGPIHEFCPTRWEPGPWSVCSATCGGGSRTQEYDCFSGIFGPLDDEDCATAKPESQTEVCNTQACPTYYWNWVDSGSCLGPCNSSQGSRFDTYECRAQGTDAPAPGQCNSSNPSGSVSCSKDLLEGCTFGWVAGDYGECSGCGSYGRQDRLVNCRLNGSASGQVVSDAYCSGTAPSSWRYCDTGIPCPPDPCDDHPPGHLCCWNDVQMQEYIDKRCVSSWALPQVFRCHPEDDPFLYIAIRAEPNNVAAGFCADYCAAYPSEVNCYLYND